MSRRSKLQAEFRGKRDALLQGRDPWSLNDDERSQLVALGDEYIPKLAKFDKPLREYQNDQNDQEDEEEK